MSAFFVHFIFPLLNHYAWWFTRHYSNSLMWLKIDTVSYEDEPILRLEHTHLTQIDMYWTCKIVFNLWRARHITSLHYSCTRNQKHLSLLRHAVVSFVSLMFLNLDFFSPYKVPLSGASCLWNVINHMIKIVHLSVSCRMNYCDSLFLKKSFQLIQNAAAR